MPALDHLHNRTDNHHATGATPAYTADHAEHSLLSDDYEVAQNVAGFFLVLNDWLNSSTTH
ncbi:hypothetical protein [Geobacter sp. AOG1]|uniref:hypothetical protein n=1 Tax=Geobacter sp. AOG1 TaxID=1566346 RepID=UPI001CC34352|nr:hypothetical protein [Geobacter sp. AOG1]GFE56738.1 hypothetical protein AOG1_06170 [Geobacter sp. AOG1]